MQALPLHSSLFVIVILLCTLSLLPWTSAEEMPAMDMSQRPNLEHDQCTKYNASCSECARAGCNWCAKASGPSFCTSIMNSTAALCTLPGCNSDAFADGGCNSGALCDECATIPGCGYCQNTGDGNVGCMDATLSNGPSERCTTPGSVWSTGRGNNCSAICEKRFVLSDCMTSSRICVWDEGAQKCSHSKTGKSYIIPKPTAGPTTKATDAPKVTDAPKPNPNTVAPTKPDPVQDLTTLPSDFPVEPRESVSSALIFVLVVGFVVGIVIVRKLRQ